MKVDKLKISNFRNHARTEIAFCSGFNIIYGQNGAGKTSILEALSIAGLSKSFTGADDKSLLKTNEMQWQISTDCKTDLEMPYSIKFEYSTGKKKKISGTLGDNLSPKKIIGQMPIVALSPQTRQITAGSPADRRQFLDMIICQISAKYYCDLLDLKKIIKNRNAFLSHAKANNKYDKDEYLIWNEMLINCSVPIMQKRNKVIKELIEYFNEAYNSISSQKEIVSLKYAPHIDVIDFENDTIKHKIYEKIFKLERAEFARGMTLLGPQKDDLAISISDMNAKDAASQGQHKSLVISLKLAEYKYMYDTLGEQPIVLLDDIFSELDEVRVAQLIEILAQLEPQIFITLTETNKINKLKAINHKLIYIMDGNVSHNYT